MPRKRYYMTEFVRNSVLLQLRRATDMELAKAYAIGTGIINVFLYIGAWAANLDSIKSSILFILAVIMTGYRFYRWAISERSNADHKRSMQYFERQEKELELRERELEDLQRQIEVQERQEQLIRRINGNQQ